MGRELTTEDVCTQIASDCDEDRLDRPTPQLGRTEVETNEWGHAFESNERGGVDLTATAPLPRRPPPLLRC